MQKRRLGTPAHLPEWWMQLFCFSGQGDGLGIGASHAKWQAAKSRLLGEMLVLPAGWRSNRAPCYPGPSLAGNAFPSGEGDPRVQDKKPPAKSEQGEGGCKRANQPGHGWLVLLTSQRSLLRSLPGCHLKSIPLQADLVCITTSFHVCSQAWFVKKPQ